MQAFKMAIGAAALAMVLASASASAQTVNPPISRDQLEVMFKGMRTNTPWDVDGSLLWGYFFTDRAKAPLESAAAVLVSQGYRLVEIRRNGPAAWLLHVEKVEHHTVDSLDTRNAEFRAFASDRGLGSYDGMDVGPPP